METLLKRLACGWHGPVLVDQVLVAVDAVRTRAPALQRS
jgi:hypothetical protein